MIFDCRGKNNRNEKEYNDLINPLNRIINYNKYYSPLLPFNLSSLNTDEEILSGDTLSITFTATGEAPDSINLNYIINDNQYVQKISHRKEIFE